MYLPKAYWGLGHPAQSPSECFALHCLSSRSGLEWTSSHQCTSWGWSRSTRFVDEHPPCPSRFFFSPPLYPEILYLPPPTYHLPSPPPLTPSPELQKPRAAVERELDRLELEQDPRAHEKVRCLLFFFVFFVCFVWRRLEKSSSSFFFVTLQVSYSATKKKAFFFFFFLFLNHSQNHLWSD